MNKEMILEDRRIYVVDERYHRTNGPSVIYNNGEWSWYLHGQAHRYYGPAYDTGWWAIRGDFIP